MRLEQDWEKLRSETKSLRALAVFVVGLIGTSVYVGGSLWLESICETECTCTPDLCCEISESCPSSTPCSCLSEANDWTKGTCIKSREDCGKWFGVALTMIVTGFLILLPVMLLTEVVLFIIVSHAIVKLYRYIKSSIPGVRIAFTALFSKLCISASAPSVELPTVQTNT